MIVVFLSDIHGLNAQKTSAWVNGLQRVSTSKNSYSCCFISPYDSLGQSIEPSYENFQQYIGMDSYYSFAQRKIAQALADNTCDDTVLIVGESVGATVAWRIAADVAHRALAQRQVHVLALYGSRIRDYLMLQPQCSTTLIFSQDEAYFFEGFHQQHQSIDSTVSAVLSPLAHGFLSPSHACFNANAFDDLLNSITSLGN